MSTVQTTKKQKSDKGQVEDLLKKSTINQRKINSLAVKNQKYEQEIMEYLEKHPDWFDGKTARFENGVAKYVASSKAIIPENVDLEELQEEYPSVIQLQLRVPVGKLRTFLEDEKQGEALRNLGFSVESVDNLKITPNA